MKNTISIIRPEECYGCQACSDVCPHNCISMIEDKKGFLVPKLDTFTCVKCGLCLNACPVKKANNKEKSNLKIYAASNKDSDIRKRSTSGGIFYPLAKYVIEQGGCVYGCAFDDQFNVVHICAENLDDVERCMKSKYVQSNMQNVYRQIAKKSQKQLVLFTGTPCQVAAVYSYPNINKSNLILVDVVCHGIPSPKLWRKYLAEKESQYGKIKNIKTRDKERHGCLQSETIINFKDGNQYHKVLGDDEYMGAFMRGYSLRDRCYDCQYKGKQRKSDLTIGDFTSAIEYVKEIDSFAGTSMLIVNSEKGEEVLNKIKNRLELNRVNSKKVLIDDWTWGLSIPYEGQNECFYNLCFKEKRTIERSLKRTAVLLKKNKKDKSVKQRYLYLKFEIFKAYYKYLFKL